MTHPTPPDGDARRARQKGRNRALGLTLGFLALLFFAITIVKLGLQPGALG
jgi:hypothetical protein